MSTQHSRMSPVRLISMLLAVIVSIGSAGLYYRSTIAPCDRPGLTDAEVAAYRGISLESMERFKIRRTLSSAAICVMPESVLRAKIDSKGGPKPDGPDQAQHLRALQLQDENGVIPGDGFQKAAQQMALMRAAQGNQPPPQAGIASNRWDWIGPGNIGGRIRSIVIHPTNTQQMWAASIAGGIWFSSNGGTSWQPVNDFMANLAVSTMVLDPTNPSIMYAGTGEGFYNGDAIRGAGVFKSIDGGVTWNQLAETATANWYFVNRLAISPDGTTLLAATRTGIWRSTNGGTSWAITSSTDDTADVDFNPSNSLLAVAGSITGGTLGPVLYSTNGGATWTAATGVPTGGRVEIAYAPSNPSIVYASVNQNSGQIWRSTDGGQSYTLRNSGTSYLAGQGWYGNALWVDPTNADFLIVGGIDLWKSSNGGPNLTAISAWFNAPTSAHADQHVIVAHPQFNGNTNTTVFFGNDGGIYKAATVYTVGNDPPANINGWQELNNNLGITQFYGAAGNAASGVIVGGTQDNGSLRYTGNSETWNTVFGGDGGFSAADPTNPNYVYGEYTYANVHRSTDGGSSNSGDYISGYYWDFINQVYAWKPAPYKITDSENRCALFIAPFILDPNNANRLLVGGCSLWRTNDVRTANTNSSGPTWVAIKAPTTGSAPISAIAVAPGNPDIIWVGHTNGDVYRTSNGTAPAPTWTGVDTNGVGLPNRYVTRLTIDRVDPTIVYATFGGFSADNVWRTSNSGTSWSSISGSGVTGLPSVPVRSLVTATNNPNWLYVGTEVGVFTSEDTGATWKLPQDGPSNVSVDELFWMNDTLVAATHGRGLFTITLGTVLQQDSVSWRELVGNANGAIDPGETIGITVNLGNHGTQIATNIAGTLAVTSGNATVQVGTSAYANIPSTTSQGNTTEYVVTIDPTQACGGNLSFSHTVSYNGNQNLVSNPSLSIGTPGPAVNYAYSAASVPILDNTTAEAPLTIATSGQISSVVVRINLTHTYDADLIISLIPPTGPPVLLSNRRGSNGANYTNTVFDDTAATSITVGSSPFTGTYRPEESLATLKGQSISGIWKLRVEDVGNGDTGDILGWSLDLQTPTCGAAATLTAPILSFGSQSPGGSGTVQYATFQNPSAVALVINAIVVSGDYSRSGGTCPSSLPAPLAAGASCTIGIVFTPTGAGPRPGSLSITSTAIGSPHTAALLGTGASTSTGLKVFLPLVQR